MIISPEEKLEDQWITALDALWAVCGYDDSDPLYRQFLALYVIHQTYPALEKLDKAIADLPPSTVTWTPKATKAFVQGQLLDPDIQAIVDANWHDYAD